MLDFHLSYDEHPVHIPERITALALDDFPIIGSVWDMQLCFILLCCCYWPSVGTRRLAYFVPG